MQVFDLFVIGGGSAGLKAARTALAAGHTVALAERVSLGGECFWAGCVPTKAMVRAADVWAQVRDAARFGMKAAVTDASFGRAMAYKDSVLASMGGGSPDGGLASKGGVYFQGSAAFEDPHHIRIGSEVVQADRILCAMGTTPSIPDIPGLREAGYITNREAVNLTELPAGLVVIGAGPIGLEFAQIFHRFGSSVTVVANGAQVLPREDHDIADAVADMLTSDGIRFHMSAVIERIEKAGSRKRVVVYADGAVHTIECDEILVAAGRDLAAAGLNLEASGVISNRRCIETDRFLRSSVGHIWAAGDAAGGYLFTHVASYEGRLVAENMFSSTPQPFDHRVVPRCTFIDPEVASIGITERQARAGSLPFETRTFAMEDLDRAIIHGEPRGLVKIVTNPLDGLILGAHIVGPAASSIIAEFAVCMMNHIPLSGIAATMHAYPTFPEAAESAALSKARG